HTFAVEWEETEIRWFVDGIQYASQTNWFSGGGPYPAPFDKRFHLLLNMAVGGNWPGSPDGSTQFPQELVVDWVRVWQDIGGCARPFDDMEHGDPVGNDWFSYSVGGASGGIGADPFNVEPTEGGLVSLAAGWPTGGVGERGGFGRRRPTEAGEVTHFEFWIDPVAGSDWTLRVNLQDDDDGNDLIANPPDGADDEFQTVLSVGGPGSDVLAGAGWQKVEVPLSAFVDDNSFHTGGNGVLDLVGAGIGGNGRLVNVVFEVASNQSGAVTFNTDGWRFTTQDRRIDGRLWSDLDGDGFDTGEPGIAGATVEAVASGGAVAGTAVTDAGGAYSLAGLAPGAYTVRVRTETLPGLFSPTADADGVATPAEAAFALACAEDVLGADFGFEPTNVANYCVRQPNSIGLGARLFAQGSTSISANDFELVALESVPFTFGIFFYGPDATDLPFGEGRLCVGGSIVRLLPAVAATAFGDAVRPIDFQLPPTVGLIAGSTWRFQYWYRDAAGGPSGFNTSDGLAVTFEP
ncbi:MAG: SdrD B-like domain-containing protein, partial [Planctomycetota bacterium]